MTTTVGQEPDYSFVRRPKWVISHVLVLALVIAMIVAGVWQVDRHRSRGDRNDVVIARSSEAPVPLTLIAPPGTAISVGEEEQFRRVTVTGVYRTEDEVLIRNRTLAGAPGWWVLTPLVTDDGWAVAVNRGWIPLIYDADEPRPGTEAPTGTVEIIGTVQPARTAEGFQVSDPAEGRLSSLGRPDIERLATQLEYELSPVVLQIDPADEDDLALPTPLALPSLDAGPHAAYAGQWFIFTTIALVGYPLVLRRVARGQGSSQPED